MKRLLLCVLVLLVPSVAAAHTPAELDQWEQGWQERSEIRLTAALIEERRDMTARHQPAAPAGPTLELAHRGMGSNVTDWTGLLHAYFPESEIATALRIIRCESGTNPNARNSSSGAAGLLQIMPFWADHYGIAYNDLFDPSINIEIGYRIWSEEGGWRHWACW